ncbi:MAG: ABC transporter permease subunit [Lachnospiraceae bacterium]|nr:ABC transporter permease subunit [Lachnospiraceae bacterium]
MKTSITNSKIIEKIGAVVIALFLWHILAIALGQEILLASPIRVISQLGILCLEKQFWQSVVFTMSRIIIGFMTAFICGTLLGVAAARIRIIEVLLWPYVAVIKAAPVASFIILCLIWTTAANLSVIISFLIVLPVVYTNILQGMKATDRKMLEMARVYELSTCKCIKYIYLPALKPYFLAACSIAAGMAWKSGTAAEVIGIPGGSIGEKLYKAKVYLSSADLLAWTVVIIILSVICEKLLILLVRWLYEVLEKR